jgi:hypothetical protein
MTNILQFKKKRLGNWGGAFFVVQCLGYVAENMTNIIEFFEKNF